MHQFSPPVERPYGQHVLNALVVVCEHRVGYVGLHVGLHEVEQRMKRTVCVPERQGGEVGEAFGLVDALVEAAIVAVGVLEDEGVEECVVNRCVEGLFLLLVALHFKFGKLFVPC